LGRGGRPARRRRRRWSDGTVAVDGWAHRGNADAEVREEVRTAHRQRAGSVERVPDDCAPLTGNRPGNSTSMQGRHQRVQRAATDPSDPLAIFADAVEDGPISSGIGSLLAVIASHSRRCITSRADALRFSDTRVLRAPVTDSGAERFFFYPSFPAEGHPPRESDIATRRPGADTGPDFHRLEHCRYTLHVLAKDRQRRAPDEAPPRGAETVTPRAGAAAAPGASACRSARGRPRRQPRRPPPSRAGSHAA
jgi:hypothetical protein